MSKRPKRVNDKERAEPLRFVNMWPACKITTWRLGEREMREDVTGPLNVVQLGIWDAGMRNGFWEGDGRISLAVRRPIPPSSALQTRAPGPP